MLMLVACMAMVVALTGCGGSPSDVAEDFVNAIIQKDVGAAVALYVPEFFQQVADRKQVKEDLERLSRRIDDTKLEGHAVLEVVSTPGKDDVITSINGKKGRAVAVVSVQFVKGLDKKSRGIKVWLADIGGRWNVIRYDDKLSGLNAEDEDDDLL